MSKENKQWIDDRLYEIAQADEEKDDTLNTLQARRAVLYETYLRELDEEIKRVSETPDMMREQLRDDVQQYVAETGDTDLHEHVTFARKQRPSYSPDEALAWARDNAPQFVKVKESLDKRGFDKALRNGDVSFAGAEFVPAPEVKISSKLADVILRRQHEANEEANDE